VTKLLALLAAVHSIVAASFAFMVAFAVAAGRIGESEHTFLEGGLVLVLLGAFIAGLGRIYSYAGRFWEWKGYVPSLTRATAARRVLKATSLVFVVGVVGTALWLNFFHPEGIGDIGPSWLLAVEIVLLLFLVSWNGSVVLWGARVLRAEPPSWHRGI